MSESSRTCFLVVGKSHCNHIDFLIEIKDQLLRPVSHCGLTHAILTLKYTWLRLLEMGDALETGFLNIKEDWWVPLMALA